MKTAKNLIIIICMMMTTINIYSNELSDTLSLEKAIQIGMNKNCTGNDTVDLAKNETELITEIYSKYYSVLFNQACYSSIKRTKEYIDSIIIRKNIKEEDRELHNLNIQSIRINIFILLHKQREKINGSKIQLCKILGIDNYYDVYLSDFFEGNYVIIDSLPAYNGYKENDLVFKKKKEDYNSQISLLQLLSLKKKISKEKLEIQLEKDKLNYSGLQTAVENYITEQLKYLSHLMELKELYAALLTPLIL